MIKEQVDIVDHNDQPTGEVVSLDHAHDEELLHRIAAVLVFRPNGNLIVQVHKYHARRLDHSVGGHVSAGEDYVTAAKREMQEELQLVLPLQELGHGVLSDEYYASSDSRVRHMFGVFTVQVAEGWELEETEEVDTILEMPVEEIVDLMNSQPDKFLQGFMTSLSVYLKAKNSPHTINAYNKNWGEL